MSTYINFFIVNNKKAIPIGDFSRNNYVYTYFSNYCNYEGASEINIKYLGYIKETINVDIAANKKRIKEHKDEINFLKGDNKSLEDYREIKETIGYLKEENKALKCCLYWTEILIDMINADENNKIYVGIECEAPIFEEEE